MKTENLVFVTGPIGCGKTTNAKELCKHFECSHWLEGIEEVFRYNELPTKILVLTCAPAEGLKQQFPGATVVDFYKACYDAKLITMNAENYNLHPDKLMRMLEVSFQMGFHAQDVTSLGFESKKAAKEIMDKAIKERW